MLCDQCQKNSAAVSLTQIISGERKRRNLCETCAELTLDKLPEPMENRASAPASLAENPAPHTGGRPREVLLPEQISVRELALALRLKWYQVIGVLIQHRIFMSGEDLLDFGTASLVCTHFGVKPHSVG
jgi:hypothetical protein